MAPSGASYSEMHRMPLPPEDGYQAEQSLSRERSAGALDVSKRVPEFRSRPHVRTLRPPRMHLEQWQAKCIQGYVAVHLHRRVRLEDLANVSQLRLAQFKRAFRVSFGTTPHQYVMRRRIDRAKVLMLDSRDSLKDIAQASGFAHESHLSHVFKHLTGERPAQWRRAQRGLESGSRQHDEAE